MTAIDDLLENNRRSLEQHGHGVLPTEPKLQLAILTCMDARINLFADLGLKTGDAHLVRNAGGIASDDAIRSLLLSQWLLGTRSIMAIHHTRCGLDTFEEQTLNDEIAAELRVKPPVSSRRVQRRRRRHPPDGARVARKPVLERLGDSRLRL